MLGRFALGLLLFSPLGAWAQDEAGASDWSDASGGGAGQPPAAAGSEAPGAAAEEDAAPTSITGGVLESRDAATSAPSASGGELRPMMPIPVGRPLDGEGGGGGERTIEISTPPPEQGAVEFTESGSTGLVRTDTFEVSAEEMQATVGSEGSSEGAIYQGVVPGVRDELPDFARFQRAKHPYVTWVGFQPTGNGRVFVRITQPTTFNLLQVKEDLYYLEIQGARLAFRSTKRPIDASFFPGNIASVHALNQGRNVRVAIKLKKAAQPGIRQHGSYLYVDVP
jgi:hypothetical protein